jgi:hypothetical protein
LIDSRNTILGRFQVPKNYNDENMRIKGTATAAGEAAEQNSAGENISPATIESMKTQATEDVRDVLQALEKTHAGITEGVATAVGAGTGAVGSIAALSSMGTVAGLSAAGVTTGLTAAGGLIGGGMLVGIGVLATPIAALGAVGYTLAIKLKKTKKTAALGLAVKRICDVQSRLINHEDHFREELAHINTTLETLTRMKTA